MHPLYWVVLRSLRLDPHPRVLSPWIRPHVPRFLLQLHPKKDSHLPQERVLPPHPHQPGPVEQLRHPNQSPAEPHLVIHQM